MTTYRELCAAQVAWYRQHGKHPERIRQDNVGIEYVVGDWGWNRIDRTTPEFIEGPMHAHLRQIGVLEDGK